MGLTESQSGLVGDGFQFAGNIVSSLINAYFQKGENARNRQFAASQAAQARQWQIEQWNMENAYNSPQAQMQRYIDAGLNPNLLYGDVGSGLGAAAPSVPQGETPSGVAPNVSFGADLSQYMQGRLLDAQIENLKSKTENQTIVNEFERDKQDAELKQKLKNLGLTDAQIDEVRSNIEVNAGKIKEMEANTKLLLGESSLIPHRRKRLVLDNAFTSATLQDSIKRFRNECRITESEADNAAKFFMYRALGEYARAEMCLKYGFKAEKDAAVADETAKLMHLDNANWYAQGADGRTLRNRYLVGLTEQSTNTGQLVGLQHAILQKYGPTKEVMSIINLGCESVESLTHSWNNLFGQYQLGNGPVRVKGLRP